MLAKNKTRRKISVIGGLILSLLIAGLLSGCGQETPTALPTVAITPAGPASPNSVPPTAQVRATPVIPTPTGGTGVTQPATRTQSGLTVSPATIRKANGERQAMTVELARTSQEQETGLMGRTNIPDDTGMLFVFPQSGLVSFWMKDTPTALSIAFIDEKGLILDIQDMEPFSETTHQPTKNYLTALEVPKGYFSRKGIKAGDTFVLG